VSNITVINRSGGKEPLELDKINKMVELCAYGLDVSISEVAINTHIKLTDNITTESIQQTLIKSTGDMITQDAPDYAILAGRLLVTNLRKKVYKSFDPIDFLTYIKKNTDSGVYDSILLDNYTEDEINELGDYIDYENDMGRSLSSITQLSTKYLIRDVKTGEMLEMIQETFMIIPMVIFSSESPDVRMDLVKKFYSALRDDEISLPTPIISGVRTKLRMFSSCCKIKMGDTTDSILASEYALSLMTANRAGIGVDMAPVRGVLAPVKNNTVKHTGALPLLKTIEAASKQFTQNSLRTGATAVNYPIFNWEIMDILEYKNNQGSNTTRARFIDYSIGVPDLFIKRAVAKKDWTLFSAEEVPELFKAYTSSEEFERVYLKYESNNDIRKRVVPAIDLFNKLIKERVGTGRIYINFLNNVNNQGMYKEPVTQTNLCSEIFLPTRPVKFAGLKKTKFENIRDYDLDNGMISLCILGCVNFGKLDEIDRLDELTNLMVRFLDNLIDVQEYPMDATEWPTKGYRFLGIGVSDFAHFLSKNSAILGTKKALEITHQWAERFQFGLTKASMELAKERGACEYFDQTKYSDGKLVIDTYNKNVDLLIENKLECDWEWLRGEIAKYGMRNTSLSAIPPTASSSLVSGSTQGIDPVQSLTDTYESADYTVKSIAPGIENSYMYMKAWEFPNANNTEYFKLMAILAKFIDQGMSTNQWYNVVGLPGKILDSSRVKIDILTAWKYGLKSLYYIRTKDKEDSTTKQEDSCASGACSI
jgi:ribonucleoside-diphosphate reductase alpha chain